MRWGTRARRCAVPLRCHGGADVVPSRCRWCRPAGVVLLDVAATSLAAVAHVLLDQLIYEGQLKPQHRDDVLRALLLRHKYARVPNGAPPLPPKPCPPPGCRGAAAAVVAPQAPQ